MTIRRLLLLALLLTALLPAALLTALAFSRSRDALQAEIALGLQNQAQEVAATLDQMLFERLQNVASWGHLEVMQDVAFDDVDRRVSNFLVEMKLRYAGVYTALHVLDAAGRIVASSEPGELGTQLPPTPLPWTASLPGTTLRLSAPQYGSQPHAWLQLEGPVVSPLDQSSLGRLVARMNWQVVEALLDDAAAQRRSVAIGDAQGRLLATSASRRGEAAQNLVTLAGNDMVGRARTPGFAHFTGLGWQVWVIDPPAIALAPVRRMAWAFLGLLALVAVAAALLASGLSARIARPVQVLTAYTRRFHPGDVPPPAAGPGEIRELTRAFTQMVGDLERSQQALVHASKLAAVGEFATVMAHEIRTPLGILRSSAQMLARDPQTSAESRELAGFIDSETQRLNRLVTTMLDTARTQPAAPVLQPMDMHMLIVHALALLAHSAQPRGIRLESRPLAQNACIDGDEEALLQVLLNLLTNAIQASPDGACVTAITRNDSGQLIVEVLDEGSGIAAAQRAQLFEPFVSHRKGGLGLGLAVARQIIEAHGGTITVDNGPQRGACLRITLPQGRMHLHTLHS